MKEICSTFAPLFAISGKKFRREPIRVACEYCVELIQKIKEITNNVDSESYTTPHDFIYTGTAYNFKYIFDETGLLGTGDNKDKNTVNTTYEMISYGRLSAANLEIGTDYYVLIDGVYTLVGKFTIENDEKYFIDPNNASNHISVDNTIAYYK